MKRDWPPVEFKTEETESQVVVDTGLLRFTAEKRPWMFTVRNGSGGLVCRDCPEDIDAHGNRRSLLLGWTSDDTGTRNVAITFLLSANEHLYGLGEKFTPLDKVNQTIRCWNVNPYGAGTEEAYKNIPFLVSSRGYGLFLNSTYASTWRLGSRSNISYSIHCDGPSLDLFLIYGPALKEVISSYTELTGRPPVPPKWSFGSGEFGLKADGTWVMNADEMVELCEGIRKEGLPCDILGLEPPWITVGKKDFDIKFDPRRVPDPKAFTSRLAKMGFKVEGYITPYVPVGSAMYEEGKSKGYLVKREDGTVCEEHLAWPFPERWERGESGLVAAKEKLLRQSFWGKTIFEGGEWVQQEVVDHLTEVERSTDWRLKHRSDFYILGAFVDFTNPEAVEWWQEKLKKLLDQGISAFKTDFGEEAPLDAVYHNGRRGKELYNYYSTLYQQATFNTFRQVGKRGLVLARSGYAGMQTYPTCWPGDPCSTFGEMRCVLRSGLSLGMSGVAFWMNQVGPFGGKVADELYIRWLQASVFSSHISVSLVRLFGPRTQEIVKRFLGLRYRLLPYIYSYAHEASKTGLPMMRAMALEFQDDTRVLGEDTQYMFGEELLVAPILSESNDGSGTVARNVYLPKGRWVDFWTEEAHSGPKEVLYEAPLDRIPVFVKMDSIVPLGPEMQYVGQKAPDPITLNIYIEGGASFTIHDDDEAARVECAKSPEGVALSISGSSRQYLARFIGLRSASGVSYCGNALERVVDSQLEGVRRGWSVDQRGNVTVKFVAMKEGVSVELTP